MMNDLRKSGRRDGHIAPARPRRMTSRQQAGNLARSGAVMQRSRLKNLHHARIHPPIPA